MNKYLKLFIKQKGLLRKIPSSHSRIKDVQNGDYFVTEYIIDNKKIIRIDFAENENHPVISNFKLFYQ